MQSSAPAITGMNRYILNGYNYTLTSYVGVPNYSLRIKTGGTQAVADIRTLTTLSINVKPWNAEVREAKFQDRRISILESCRYDVVKGLNDVVEWFNVEKYPDLFCINENNELEFNFDYKTLHKKIFLRDFKRKTAMVITPAIVEIGTDKYEGVRMFLNTRIVYVDLTINELEIMRDAIAKFDYSQECLLCLTAMQTGYEIKL